jgi:hypothetical protein
MKIIKYLTSSNSHANREKACLEVRAFEMDVELVENLREYIKEMIKRLDDAGQLSSSDLKV